MSAGCEQVRELAAELALGIADGEQRARALEHLAHCPECRTLLARLTATADELTLLAPAAEPPPGFEGRVVEGLAPAPRSRRRWAPVAAVTAACALALGAGAVWLALSDDRELADSYRETLAVADGEYFDAARLAVPGGGDAGYVYGYQGRASWVLAVVYDGVADGAYRLELVTAGGERRALRGLRVRDGRGSAGAVTPFDYSELTEVRLLDRRGREVADSKLGQ